MDTVPQRTVERSADEVIKDLDRALRRFGLRTEIIEPSTRIKIFSPTGDGRFDEVLTLKPNPGEVLSWFWSWDEVLGPASDIQGTAKLVDHVVRAR
jgi:hypothetical protein